MVTAGGATSALRCCSLQSFPYRHGVDIAGGNTPKGRGSVRGPQRSLLPDRQQGWPAGWASESVQLGGPHGALFLRKNPSVTRHPRHHRVQAVEHPAFSAPSRHHHTQHARLVRRCTPVLMTKLVKRAPPNNNNNDNNNNNNNNNNIIIGWSISH